MLEKAGAKPEQIGRVVHATTLFTNALIERKGARTGLLTTAGFRDVLEIGRERKYELYDLFIEMPKPLVARPWRREAKERLAPDGTVEIALDVDAALAEVADLVKQGVESLAICFLHAYANPAHERAIGAAVAERFQNLSISLSSDIAPEIREYLRASTTVANAYVRPLAEIYLERLEQALRAEGIPGGLFLMLSNGGLTHVSEAKRAPVQLLESGPAAGALAGAWFGRNAGLDRVLAFDMGGTTAKLALVDDGEPLVAYGFEAAREKRFLRGSGLPIQIATVELIEIGAGGGSIAHRSELGTLNVGPESSGAQPGPACYGRGGTRGHGDRCRSDAGLSQRRLLPGRRHEDRPRRDRRRLRPPGERARRRGRTAPPSACTTWSTRTWPARRAWPSPSAAASRPSTPCWRPAARDRCMPGTSRASSAISRVVCPPGAGAGSTIGMLMAPARVDRVASFTHAARRRRLRGRDARLRRPREGIARRAAPHRRRHRGARGRSPGRHALHRPGQRDHRRAAGALSEAGVTVAFEQAYKALFARTPPGAAIQFVALRLSVSAPMPGTGGTLELPRHPSAAALKGTRPVFFPDAGKMLPTQVFDRYALEPGVSIDGPAVFEEDESTFIVGPGATARLLADGSILAEVG